MAKQKSIFVILGSGLYGLYKNEVGKEIRIKTRYGSAAVHKLRNKNAKVYLLMRHGKGHSIPPHLINYRANAAAAGKHGVDYVIATTAVGSLNQKMRIGSYVVLDHFLDFTKARPFTIFEGSKFSHTDMSEPYSGEVRSALIRALESSGASFHRNGTYACFEGPRYETPAEIRMYRMLGADIVGMTGVPEVVFSKELGIPYGSVAIVTNMAAGMQEKISHEEVVKEMDRSLKTTRKIIDKAIKYLSKL